MLGYIQQPGEAWRGDGPNKGDVSPELVTFYEDHSLNTMTDYHAPGVMGRFAGAIYWTWLLIHTTNLMHWVLSKILWIIPSYGLAIMCLTIMVRGLMFPVSRKGALTSIRMQQLGPEIKKLQEKHKDDKQALQLATMDLYRKNGVNPFGTCWFMFLQMPIFMGLYYALQESITFRLASFWPTWIDNLAAPDMLIKWGDGIRTYPRRNLTGLPLPRPIPEPAADYRGGIDDCATKASHAAADGRTAGNAAEDDEVHDDVHGPDVLQGSGRLVHLLHRQQLVGLRRTQTAAEKKATSGDSTATTRLERHLAQSRDRRLALV